VTRLLLLTLCLSGLIVAMTEAQRPVRVLGEQDLDFGTVFNGLPEHVLPTDAARAGRFLVRGARNNVMVATFTLPATLDELGGDSFPLTYAVDDGGYAAVYSLPIQTPFDPTAPFSFTMPLAQRVRFYLGATANPGVSQTPGDYSNTVTLTVDCAAC
jgi:hypothetical protein